MTSELRPAVAVWIDAREAYARSHKPDPKGGRYTFADPFAPAAVIEADREAVRAYWYRQGKDDGWQCREEQAAELAKYKALAETLAGYAEHKGGCRRGLWPEITPTLPCDCGLSDAQRQYNEACNANPI